MKKYKLIKEYPNSPQLGSIAVYDKSSKFYNVNLSQNPDTSCIKTFARISIERYPDHWQEIKEKEYEILAIQKCYKDSNKQILQLDWSKIFLTKSCLELDWISDNLTIEAAIKNWVILAKTWRIYSVKRLSDGEVFTINDVVDFSLTKNIKIIEFKLVEDVIIVYSNLVKEGFKYIKKSKQKLFTTEDGVDIFEGEEYYYIHKDVLEVKKCRAINSKFGQAKIQVYFSTKEKAEEYIIMNKPCLSVNDLIYNDKGGFRWSLNSLESKIFKELVKSKLNLK